MFCTKCGKELPNDAMFCSYCGNKVQKTISEEKKEDLIHCPKCDSTQLTSEQKGFSGGKALAGALVAGGIGILAGTLGSNKIVITCLNCGNQFKPGEGAKQVLDGDTQKLIELAKKSDIQAVQYYIKIRKCGISEAKNYVDNLKKEHGI